MNLDNFIPLQEYLDTLPDVKWWQFRTRFIIWWLDMIDNYHIWKYNKEVISMKRKHRRFTN